MSWNQIFLEDIKIGDYIKGVTSTHSQKWFIPGYEDYNATKVGKVVSVGSDLHNLKVMMDDGTISHACLDPGSSGSYELMIWEQV